jgi:hypothetical protein
MSILRILADLQVVVEGFSRMKDAPKQMDDFKLKSVIFCDILHMLHDTSRPYVAQKGEIAQKRMSLMDALLLHGRIVVDGSQKLLNKLKSLEKDAKLKPWKVWWQKVKWVLNEGPVARLEVEMNLAFSATSCFVNMLSIQTRVDQVESPGCTEEEKERLMQEMYDQHTLYDFDSTNYLLDQP